MPARAVECTNGAGIKCTKIKVEHEKDGDENECQYVRGSDSNSDIDSGSDSDSDSDMSAAGSVVAGVCTCGTGDEDDNEDIWGDDGPDAMEYWKDKAAVEHQRTGALRNLYTAQCAEMHRLRASSHEKLTCAINELSRLKHSFVEQKKLAEHKMGRERAAGESRLASLKFTSREMDMLADRAIEMQDKKIQQQNHVIEELQEDVAKLRAVQEFVGKATTSTTAATGCPSEANTAKDPIVAKNCLLQNPVPSVISDWNIGAVSSAMIIWFLASLATSVGTLPIINSYVSLVSVEDPSVKGVVIKWNRYIIAAYLFITVSAIIVPIIVTAVQFPGSAKHMQSVMGILMWSAFAIGILGSYNCQTIIRYLGYGVIPSTATHEHEKNDTTLLHMTLNNWVLYVHLLVSAPAIAMVLHLTQQWTEFHTIMNTTLVLSTIFAVDAFSVEMTNFWAHRTTKSNLLKIMKDSTDEEVKDIQDLHTRLGIIRLFAWIVNAVMLLLLFTLAYPIEIEQNNNTKSAIFVVVVVAFAAVFLSPDLVREFTDIVSFNSIQFRLYGDFMMRALVLFFVWRASVVERT
ncbi:hypothetical protein T484DRAFT_1854944 [Baffinella frigidus]|nr:hypothetical protein T484DRAFT_1854944 [Cryptophyta sp. CCMP2293]